MKSLILAAALLAIAPTTGAAPTLEPATSAARGAFLALSVPDAEASAKWYGRAFGLKVASRPPGTNKIAVIILEGDGLVVELIQSADARSRADQDPTRVQGLFKAGFIVDDLEVVLARLKAEGIAPAYGPYPAKDGQRANLIVRDNAGNLIQVFGKAK